MVRRGGSGSGWTGGLVSSCYSMLAYAAVCYRGVAIAQYIVKQHGAMCICATNDDEDRKKCRFYSFSHIFLLTGGPFRFFPGPPEGGAALRGHNLRETSVL